MPRTPTAAIVGRPNVGKSTLFNRLVGRRQAIVHDQPGVTRDRIVGSTELDGRRVDLIDTGGLVPGDDPLGLNRQVMAAVEESDLLLFVVDGKEGLVAADRRVWDELRPLGKPVVLVVNKGDTRLAQEGHGEFYALGVAELVLVSAEHGGGLGDLVEAMAALLPEEPVEEAPPDLPRLAIVGRPNVGKSSILNRLVGQERALVSDRPGTTRDPVDTVVGLGGREYLLTDTAGIRRRSRMTGAPEELAVMMARRQLESSDLALLVIDASEGVTSGDLAIAGAVNELGRAAVVLVNKWDLLDEESRRRLEESWPRLALVLHEPTRVNVSALTGRGLERLAEPVAATLDRFATRLTTAAVNRLLEEALRRQPPPSHQGRPWKVYYATQVSAGPPTFLLFANRRLPLTSSYRRYLENRLRAELDLAGVPVRLVVKQRSA
ncbi:MAG: ribosome biogenesis GTPase Der [Thermoanaerobaculia bacterium]|nr:ribosome biogenesis GTPase Der [Thermoanaerobaculia bacterium]